MIPSPRLGETFSDNKRNQRVMVRASYYKQEVNRAVTGRIDNDQQLNISKTEEIIADYRLKEN